MSDVGQYTVCPKERININGNPSPFSRGKHTGAKPKVPKTSTRGVQRVFTNSNTKRSGSKPHTPTPEREMGVEAGEEQPANAPPQPPQNWQQHRPAFQPFCENPEVTRQRAEQRRRDRDYNRGWVLAPLLLSPCYLLSLSINLSSFFFFLFSSSVFLIHL